MVANTSICIMHNFKTNTYLKYDKTAELGITRYSVTLMDQRLVDVKLKAWQSTEVDLSISLCNPYFIRIILSENFCIRNDI